MALKLVSQYELLCFCYRLSLKNHISLTLTLHLVGYLLFIITLKGEKVLLSLFIKDLRHLIETNTDRNEASPSETSTVALSTLSSAADVNVTLTH